MKNIIVNLMLKQFKKIFSLLNYAYPVILGLSVSFFISSIFYYKFNVITPAENSFSKSEIRKNKNSVDIDFILKTNFFGIKTEEKPVNIPEKEVEKPLPKKNEEILEITDEKFNGKLIGIITGKENLALITFKNKFLLLRLNKKIDDITLKKISPKLISKEFPLEKLVDNLLELELYKERYIKLVMVNK